LGSFGRLLGIQLRTAGLGYLGVGSKLDRRRQAIAKLNLCATTAPSVLHAELWVVHAHPLAGAGRRLHDPLAAVDV
jgi:hypothetical protein